MTLLCVGTLVVITLLFSLLGRLLGAALERVPRLPAYTANIAGSLAGILGFLGASLLEMPPVLWFAVGLVPLLWWAARGRDAALFLGLAAASCVAVLPSHGDTVWSRYQKLVGHPVGKPGNEFGYMVRISDVFYQIAVDRSPDTLARSGQDPLPHYGRVYQLVPRPERVLIVGAGTGNDVAAALHAGAAHVDAVDIDPAIVRMGRLHHPERPYDDPRVRVVVDDARHAFRVLEPEHYDLVMFGLLDSHTQLGLSSVRLDNYVFTTESLAEAGRLLAPGGRIAIIAAVFEPWFGKRLEAMLHVATGGPVRVERYGSWTIFLGPPRGADAAVASSAPPRAAPLPSDDWPFLYLPERAVPIAYLWVVGAMAVASVLVLRFAGLPFGRFDRYHGHLFFLGAAFLLMEVHAINRLALLYGTTWLVSAVTIGLVLALILGANATAMALPRLPYALAYGGLAASLTASFLATPGDVIAGGAGPVLALSVVLLSPVYFAGLVFARSFRSAPLAGPAIGANILGSVLGGWIEYSTMALGMRALVVLAAGFYALSLLLLLRRRES
jgi:SAM-dependent methyltransferase